MARVALSMGLLALAVGAAAAAKADPCAPTFNFFPTADEIGLPQLVNNKTCKGDAVCNFPGVWAEANQTKYMSKLDTSIANGLLSVAFKQYGNEKPRLFFAPVTPLLAAGGDATACALSRFPAPTATRRLHQADAYAVKTPGTWSYKVAYDGQDALPGNRIAAKSGELDPLYLSKDGHHCAEITVTVTGAQLEPAVADWPSSFESTQTVCWYKLSTQTKATFDFDMCTTKTFTLNVSNIAPLPTNLTQNGTALSLDGKPALLFRPVVHLFGRKNRTLDGTVLKELEYDNMNNPINFINKYIVLPSNFTANETLSFVLDEDSLDEGYYALSAKVALVSGFPDLVDLTGRTAIVQADAYGEDVRGFTEYGGVTIVNETSTVGVQKSKTTISEITSDKLGAAIQAGDTISFFWRFAGIGTERCYHDKVEVPDCASGIQIYAKDMSDKATEHTFRVVFEDVCGGEKVAEYKYTQAGVEAVSKVDYIPVETHSRQLPPRAVQNSAAALAPAGAAAALAAVLALLLVGRPGAVVRAGEQGAPGGAAARRAAGGPRPRSLAAALRLPGRAALAGPCDPVVDLAPTANEITPGFSVDFVRYTIDGPENVTCDGADVCNAPVWGTAAQGYASGLTALAGGPLPAGAKLLRAVLPTADSTLYFTLSSPLLTFNATADACAPVVLPTRRLLVPVPVTVATPGTWAFTIAIDGGAPVAGTRVGSAGRLTIGADQTGSHCAVITATVSGWATEPISNITVPAATVELCWWMPEAGQASADEPVFDTCADDGVLTVNVSGLAPLAEPLTYGAAPVAAGGAAAQLVQPMVQVYGQKVKELNGTNYTAGSTDNGGQSAFVNLYRVLPANYSGEPITLALTGADGAALDEGAWELTVKVALVTDYAALVGLPGANPIVQNDTYGDDVRGKTEIMGQTYAIAGRGVSRSAPLLSAISSDKEGAAIATGDNITFSWTFSGLEASQVCVHGNTTIDPCEPGAGGLVVAAQALADAEAEVTFSVLFTDVCGRNATAEYKYTQRGVQLVSVVDDGAAAGGGAGGAGAGGVAVVRNAAAGLAGPAAGFTLAAGLLAALLL
ncbi:hypothetical protein HT031_003091 [Scenedesmus sp. PABB004]|nr:hypothetical protein HT031_003091 [Scenedesmus sp. PABB004]